LGSICGDRGLGAGLASVAVALLLLITGCASAAPKATALASTSKVGAGRPKPGATGRPKARHLTTQAASVPGVTERTMTFVDYSRRVRFPHAAPGPRRLVTVIRYPSAAKGPLPLIVFGHGFAVTPAYYFRLLDAWAAAGYVVAAPVFPLENLKAPGGPNESDLINQPRDMSFVITSMLTLSGVSGNILSGRINPKEIGVSGQSDGGETALAMAYDRFFLDPRVRAAAILSGAIIPGTGLYFPRGSPPLLATQGTADNVNQPHFTYDFFAQARRPKYLLKLLGAPHLPPYTYEQPQLSIVGRVTTAFFKLYLKHERSGLTRMEATGNLPGLAALTVDR
jgi:dienelactone hydrolase